MRAHHANEQPLDSQNDRDDIYFESLKEARSGYFVEYLPPRPHFQYATLQVVITRDLIEEEKICEIMEAELVIWLRRYPIPVMLSAYDNEGELINLESIRGCNFLIGYSDDQHQRFIHEWRLVKNEELPKFVLDKAYLKKVYQDIPYKTDSQLQRSVQERGKNVRRGLWIIIFWVSVIPAAFAIAEWRSELLGGVVMFFSIYKAVKKAFQLKGKWPKSKAEREREAEAVKREHYHYHCELNPEGFQRLKVENLQRLARDQISEEARELEKQQKK